jgi:hypothetical protein
MTFLLKLHFKANFIVPLQYNFRLFIGKGFYDVWFKINLRTVLMIQTIFEKLQYADEKNLLIQGLPSSIEKQFNKITFAKNMTPLLKARRLDFALVFAVNENQLNGILNDVMPSLKENTKFWIAHPKATSKIVTNLNRESSWSKLTDGGYSNSGSVELDHVWTATRYEKIGKGRSATAAKEKKREVSLL